MDVSPGDVMNAGVDLADSVSLFLATLAVAAVAMLLFLVIWPIIAIAAASG